MVQMQTYLKVADNTGAKELMCFRVLGGTPAGDTQTLVASWSALSRRAAPAVPLEAATSVSAVIVQSKLARRAADDSSYIRFDENAAVIVITQEPQRVPGNLWTRCSRAA